MPPSETADVNRAMLRPFFLALALAIALAPRIAAADGNWLDAPTPQSWTEPGAAVPQAPPFTETFQSMCLAAVRPVETMEDQQVVEAGWMLIGAYQGAWGIKLVQGATYFDGMCRPLSYQVFVFVDGRFAGTVSPLAMDSRSDGAATTELISRPDQLTVSFVRYESTDPLCCPSRRSLGTYEIDRSSGWPVVALTSVFTTPST